jgi:hypothetical protein
MKKIYLLVLSLCFSSLGLAQFSLRADMGIDFVSTPSLTDYVNQNFAGGDQLGSFNSAVNFSVEGNYPVSRSYSLGVEIAYQLNSYTFNFSPGQYDLSYGIILPSIMNYYVISGNGYNLKFGAGAGIRFINVTETAGTGIKKDYSATGFGGVFRFEGNTALSSNIYANIGADIRYDLNGEPESDGKKLYNNVLKENVNFNTLSFGVKLGILFQF